MGGWSYRTLAGAANWQCCRLKAGCGGGGGGGRRGEEGERAVKTEYSENMWQSLHSLYAWEPDQTG